MGGAFTAPGLGMSYTGLDTRIDLKPDAVTISQFKILDDDKKFFPPYNITFAIRNEALDKLGPEGQKVIEDVQKPLTEKVMQELNARVDVDKQKPEEVAKAYLQSAGFIPKS